MPTAVIINDTRVDHHHGCSRVMNAFQNLAASSGIDIIGTSPAHCDWRRNAGFKRHFRAADLVIVNGEGTIHHNRPAAEPLMAAAAVAKKMGKRSALVNFSWFNNDRSLAEGLRDFDLLSARESMSLDTVRSIRADCRLVPDLSYCGPLSDSVQRAGVGFGDSVLPAESSKLFEIGERYGGRFIPIRFSGPGFVEKLHFARSFISKDMLADLPALYRGLQAVSAHLRSDIADPSIFMATLSKLRLLITGRFHGLSLALCANTPVLALRSNTPKIEAMLFDIGLEPFRLTSADAIDERTLTKAAHWQDDEREHLRRYLAMATEQAEQLFHDIRGLA